MRAIGTLLVILIVVLVLEEGLTLGSCVPIGRHFEVLMDVVFPIAAV
jgi:hypothetical protein